MRTNRVSVHLDDSLMSDLRVVLEYKRSSRRRARSAGPVLPTDADDLRLLCAITTAINFAGRCAREAMAGEGKDFASGEEGGREWGDAWDLSDLSDDMRERPCGEL